MVGRLSKAEELERALLFQLERLETRINNLRLQQAALRSTLMEHRNDRLSHKGQIRKNSFSKMLIQKRVVDKIRNHKGDVQVEQLYNAANKESETHSISMSTFRSHLHRMKRDGILVSGHARGAYKIGPNAPKM